jgi:glycosyltransferase involved in cell wall biosynthesis
VKIALLSYEYPPHTGFGGIGTYTWHHARALAKLGHEVHVIAGATEHADLQSAFSHGVTVWRVNGHGPLLRTAHLIGALGLPWTRSRLEIALNARRAVRELDRRIGFDVIEGPECGADGLFASQVSDAPIIVRLQSPAQVIMPFYRVSRADTVTCSAIEAWGMRRAHHMTASSAFVASEVRRVLGEARPIPVIPNGIDLDWFDSQRSIDATTAFGLTKNKVTIFFGARMERRKGLHLFREILLGVLARHDVSIVLAGADESGYVQSTLLPELRARATWGSVTYLGALGLGEVRSCLRHADIYLFPSLWDSCPSAILEAMAASKAIIASDAGGLPELIAHGVSGLMAPADQPMRFVDALSELIESRGHRERLGTAARQTVEDRFTDELVARQSLEVYESART